jgi:hypothetical protein
MLHDASDFDTNDSVDEDDFESRKAFNKQKVSETHSYVDVLAHRLNDVD